MNHLVKIIIVILLLVVFVVPTVQAESLMLGTGTIKGPDGGCTEETDSFESCPSGWSSWGGSFVYFGKFGTGESTRKAVLYRVLSPNTSDFGGNTMLLDCDTVLTQIPFDSTGNNIWSSSTIKSWLNNDFLQNDEFFSNPERSSIFDSKKNNAATGDGRGYEPVGFAPLDGDKLFLLDAKEATRTNYGYRNNWRMDLIDHARVKNYFETGEVGCWWLRSPRIVYPLNKSAGDVHVYGTIGSANVDITDFGVSPALNIELSSILFSSNISENTYKLTLLDEDISIIEENSSIKKDVITVSYSLSGNDSGKVTNVSIMITDKNYTDSNARILQYTNLIGDIGDEGTFSLEENLDIDEWGSNYQVYLVAEVELKDDDEFNYLNYAGEPLKLAKPQHNHNWIYTTAENEIVASCNTSGHTEGNHTLTLNLPLELTYNGQPKNATYMILPEGSSTFGTPEIVYKQGNATLTDPPVNAGLYTAVMTAVDKSVTANFTIKKAPKKDFEISLSKKYDITSLHVSSSDIQMPEDTGSLAYSTGDVSVIGSAVVSDFTVDLDGKVNATLSKGSIGDLITLSIIISSENYEDSLLKINVNLTEKDDAIVKIQEGNSLTVTLGELLTLHAYIANQDFTGTWSWSSNDQSKAIINDNGEVTLLTTGQVIITAKYESDMLYGEASIILTIQQKSTEKYTISVISDGNGVASASHENGETGTVVSLQAKPNNGYEFDRWEILSGDIQIDNDSFTVGSMNVEIKARFVNEISNYLHVYFSHYQQDGIPRIPDDIEDQIWEIELEITKNGETFTSKANLLIEHGKRYSQIQFPFIDKLNLSQLSLDDKIIISNYPTRVKDKIYSTEPLPDKYKYTISIGDTVPTKDSEGNTILIVRIKWDDGSRGIWIPEELKVVALPEDEIGSYKILEDGSKEYLLFHTYQICMEWLGRDDICRGPERCYHKESPYVNPFVKP